MLVSTQMITGFNTDVPYEGHVYHVQTEDGGRDNPSFQSLVYIGGTIVAKKLTPYPEPVNDESRPEKLALLLKRQHQVIIAAIKAGRIEDLIRHSNKQQSETTDQENEPETKPVSTQAEEPLAGDVQSLAPISPPEIQELSSNPPTSTDTPRPESSSLFGLANGGRPARRASSGPRAVTPTGLSRGDTAGLNLDQVLEDYVKRGAGHAKLEVKVLTPEVFTAGRGIGLRVQVTHDKEPDCDATVTVKIIGTAFRPQVFIGRVGRDGVASFSLTLPSFSTGTAAIVIEAQSGTGRGELKNLIRRA